MTDRVKGLIVVLDEDYRTDDCEKIITAIQMIKGVLKVDEMVVDPNDYANRLRIKMEIEEKIRKIFRD